MKTIMINASPRKNWNTAQLLRSAQKGAESVGAETEYIDADPDTVAGGPKLAFCSELWDAISRYIYTGLQGGSIMKGWMDRENEMIACCSDGTRPVIFKVERIDYE